MAIVEVDAVLTRVAVAAEIVNWNLPIDEVVMRISGDVALRQQLRESPLSRQQYEPKPHVCTFHATTGRRLPNLVRASGHITGQLGSFPVWSVHPFCHIVPMYMPSVAMQSPLSRQISGEPLVLRVAQQPLTLEFDLHGAYEESSGVPLSP